MGRLETQDLLVPFLTHLLAIFFCLSSQHSEVSPPPPPPKVKNYSWIFISRFTCDLKKYKREKSTADVTMDKNSHVVLKSLSEQNGSLWSQAIWTLASVTPLCPPPEARQPDQGFHANSTLRVRAPTRPSNLPLSTAVAGWRLRVPPPNTAFCMNRSAPRGVRRASQGCGGCTPTHQASRRLTWLCSVRSSTLPRWMCLLSRSRPCRWCRAMPTRPS